MPSAVLAITRGHVPGFERYGGGHYVWIRHTGDTNGVDAEVAVIGVTVIGELELDRGSTAARVFSESGTASWAGNGMTAGRSIHHRVHNVQLSTCRH
jgi:hypothetical protein